MALIKMKNIPHAHEPRYPAGSIIHLNPPRLLVTPPPSVCTSIPSTFPQVSHVADACPNSCKKTASIWNGKSTDFVPILHCQSKAVVRVQIPITPIVIHCPSLQQLSSPQSGAMPAKSVVSRR
eukprot:GHVT01077322.1.p2 GENE.GHVT01077322.1~~GHVT01077322.1.p2  ORF type:complete len:123 (-),score=5.41 GHVT01077322.1:530-898(-)